MLVRSLSILPLRLLSAVLALAPLVLACGDAEDSVGSSEADYSSCSAYDTCDACTSGINCFWNAGCCVPLSVDDYYPRGTASPGKDYAAHPAECGDYASHHGGESSIHSSAVCTHRSPAPPPPPPAPPEPTESCPGGTLIEATTNTPLTWVTTGSASNGCFALDVLLTEEDGDQGGCACHAPLEAVAFRLCESERCAKGYGFDSDVVSRVGSWQRASPGYFDQASSTRLVLTATSMNGKPAKVCYRNVHAC